MVDFDLVTMQAQKEAPPDMQCRDKFLLQSVKVNDGVTANDITAEMLDVVEECKLRVVYVSPASPVQEGSEEGSSAGVSVSDGRCVQLKILLRMFLSLHLLLSFIFW
ncbi:vesicle-associated protein 1-1-like [Hibiscus syriacus]|uniref:vesicle-associated protein 1-1-like n=1 Tax=Hibiscus syriacus TaxID=106335 RepID=UPI0019240BD0|nr:vesicle-associated protein 1-1-like [Hibiscus syriacus]